MITHETDAGHTEPQLRSSGIDVLSQVAWGSHICNFYDSKQDLLEILVPYYKAGLENNEFCLWIAAQVTVEEAMDALHKAMPDLGEYIEKKCIEIIPYEAWYLEGGEFNASAVMHGWMRKLEAALKAGFEGMRVHGNECWLTREVWKDFIEYEKELNTVFPDRRMIVLCTYPLSKCDANSILDVAHAHECAIAKRKGRWEILEVPPEPLTRRQQLAEKKELEKLVSERTASLAAANRKLTEEINQHQQTLQTLEIAERNYREIFDKASDGIFVIEKKTGKIIDCNVKACLLTGYSKEDVTTGRPIHISSINMGNSPDETIRKIQQVSNKGDHIFEWQVRFKDGTVHWVEVSMTTADIAGKKRILSFFHLIDDRKRAEFELEKEKHRKQIEITDAVITAAENERQEIGQELHDNIQQILSSAKLYLGMAMKGELKQHPRLIEADHLLKTAVVELRNLSHSMISPFIEEYGLVDALDRLADTTAGSTELTIEKQIGKLDEADIPDKLKLAIYRVAQEQFSNIIKYANASNVILKLMQHQGTILLKIKDDGIGFQPGTHTNGIGFINMKTRAALFGGTIQIRSAPGEGCEVKMVFN